MKIVMQHKYEDMVSIDNLLSAWQEFVKGKRSKRDVQEFSFHLMDNIIDLHKDLINRAYKHGGYQRFKISDPKPRTIHKASVRDRLVHHAVYRILYPFFDKTFISDSYSCRNDKGTHKAVNKFREYGRIVSKNNTKTCWILKCDIKKFFASVDQGILINILQKHIPGKDIIRLLSEIIFSFKPNGLPLGNLTSQLFANIYLDKFDQFAKQKLGIRHYIRYADDFIILSQNKKELQNLIPEISGFLKSQLRIAPHPDKIFIKTLSSGVDFLGWVNFPDHRVLRVKTKKRIFRRMEKNLKAETINSYFGLLKHGNSYKILKGIISFNNR